MSKIVITNLNNQQLLSNNNSRTVLDIIHDNYIDWMHSCGKKGRCTTCKMLVVEGMENISALSKFEKKYTANRQLSEGERLACQCTIHGDIAIKIPEECKMPHVNYSD